jgi:hypothetical protein
MRNEKKKYLPKKRNSVVGPSVPHHHIVEWLGWHRMGKLNQAKVHVYLYKKCIVIINNDK